MTYVGISSGSLMNVVAEKNPSRVIVPISLFLSNRLYDLPKKDVDLSSYTVSSHVTVYRSRKMLGFSAFAAYHEPD